MQKIIQNLRQRPEQERRQILHIAIIGCSVILVMLWAYSLGRTITDPTLPTKVAKDLQPFQKLSNDLSKTYNATSPQNLQSNTSNLDLNQ